MSSDEDLDTPESRSFATHLDDWEQIGDDEGSNIIFEADGSFGNVHTIKYDRRPRLSPPLNGSLRPELESLLINLAYCVGKISAFYYQEGETDQASAKALYYRGSGFWVSPTTVLTTSHVLKSPRTIEGKQWILSQLFIDNQASIQRFDRAESIELKIPKYQEGSPKYWKSSDYDLTIVEALNEEYRHPDYAIPVNLSVQCPSPCAVISYPTSISLEKFKLDFKPFPSTIPIEQCYTAVSSAMAAFSHRIISQNSCEPLYDIHHREGLLLHNCPTLRGTSGGLLVDLNTLFTENRNVFTGIHLGGDVNMRINYAISTSHPKVQELLHDFFV